MEFYRLPVAFRWRTRLLHARLWITRGELRCGCFWDDRYGPVVMGGCRRHD